jgi:hypothetical protein
MVAESIPKQSAQQCQQSQTSNRAIADLPGAPGFCGRSCGFSPRLSSPPSGFTLPSGLRFPLLSGLLARAFMLMVL